MKKDEDSYLLICRKQNGEIVVMRGGLSGSRTAAERHAKYIKNNPKEPWEVISIMDQAEFLKRITGPGR